MRESLKILAELFRLVPSGTPFGGQAVSHAPLGLVWLAIARDGLRRGGEAGGQRRTQTLDIACRSDPRLEVGHMLRLSGGDWIIEGLAGDPARPGRMRLTLERRR